LNDFIELIISVDASATKWFGATEGNYTTWRPYEIEKHSADNLGVERLIKIQIDRFTRLDADPVVYTITDILNQHPDEIAYRYLIDFEQDTKYIHHIWDCEVI